MRHNENGTQPADKTKKTPQKKSRKKKIFAKKLQSATRKRKIKSETTDEQDS